MFGTKDALPSMTEKIGPTFWTYKSFWEPQEFREKSEIQQAISLKCIVSTKFHSNSKHLL